MASQRSGYNSREQGSHRDPTAQKKRQPGKGKPWRRRPWHSR